MIAEPSSMISLKEIRAKVKSKLNAGTNDNVKIFLRDMFTSKSGNFFCAKYILVIHFCQCLHSILVVEVQTMDIAHMAIQVGGAREGQSFDLKI
jgi:hypothetical protein